ncbi:MAG: hypothetical protein M3R37_07820, partial [Actinomycetota bacterium]|nr:hypothetical protein [Actinomycetota bacterium]
GCQTAVTVLGFGGHAVVVLPVASIARMAVRARNRAGAGAPATAAAAASRDERPVGVRGA